MDSSRIIRTNDRVIGGVCSALARRFNISAKLVRVLFLISTFFNFYIGLAYFILWICTPYENVENEKPYKFSLQNAFDTKALPKWFVIYSYSSLYPILLWPLIVYPSLFFFDNPGTLALAFIIFILIISYPIIFLVLTVIGFKTYRKNKLIASLLPLIPISCGLIFLYCIFIQE